ncbi:hypothetical protein G3A56_14610 [Rhizobium oryzihabitans]|uniref:Uncharacterized protein n=1 Tax=Rhizobium oryzihabitans TaxID=2267833 RepID=A0A7L5BCJ6_9HYPH|nr:MULTISPECIES: hypothetical protein [Rhizobium]QIB36584.1 hypothetical protein G3A56_14610 [Rhizobium oryzihabitans]HCD84028.1 hypothetical protein [Agrobacterium sp.]
MNRLWTEKSLSIKALYGLLAVAEDIKRYALATGRKRNSKRGARIRRWRHVLDEALISFRIKKEAAWQDEVPDFRYGGMENVIKV